MNQSADNDAARMALETLWGCGPGEVLTEFVGADVDGGPGVIPVGQICKSSAHNYAYWSGSCQFASDAASVISPASTDPVSRVQAIEAAEDHADQVAFDAERERRP